MKTVTVTTLRANLKMHLDLVSRSLQTLIIPRSKEDEPVVIMPLSEYNSIIETSYLMSTEANRDRLKKSMSQADQGEVFEYEFE